MAQSPLTQLLNAYGQYLKPMTPMSQVLSQQDWMKPFNEVFNTWETTSARPEFEQQQYNPGMQKLADTSATQYGNMMGNNPMNFKRQQRDLVTPYYNQLESARQSYNDMALNQYNQRINQYYNNPNAFITGAS